MKRILGVALAAVVVTGCAGIKIQPIEKSRVGAGSWGTKGSPEGYVVYHPQLVLEIVEKRDCGDDKECKNPAYSCVASKPFYVPDFSRPYQITSRAGLGKAGLDVSIVDGWQLSGIKDNSDNTAFLAGLSTILKPQGLDGTTDRCAAKGLYTLDAGGAWVKLQDY